MNVGDMYKLLDQDGGPSLWRVIGFRDGQVVVEHADGPDPSNREQRVVLPDRLDHGEWWELVGVDDDQTEPRISTEHVEAANGTRDTVPPLEVLYPSYRVEDADPEMPPQPRTLEEWGEAVHAWAVQRGWWEGHDPMDPVHYAAKLACLCTEVCEAIEDVRTGNDRGVTYRESDGKPEGLAIELADVFIYAVNMARARGIDLQRAAEIKMDFNRTRPYRHGGKKF